MAELRVLLVDVGGVLVDDRKWPVPGDEDYLNHVVRANLREVFGQEHPWFNELLRLRFMDSSGPEWRQPTLDILKTKLCEWGVDLCEGDLRRVCRAYVLPMKQTISLEPSAAESMREARAL